VATYKEQCDLATEELETVRTHLLTANERCRALEFQLQDLARERDTEAAQHQQMLREYDARLEEAQNRHSGHHSSSVAAGQNSGGEEQDQLQRELQSAQAQIASLSDQLMRQQGLAESSKSEVLALKGRLQVAIQRAEAAEQQSTAAAEIEMGTPYSNAKSTTRRRRIKGGSSKARFSSLPSHSIRGAVGLNAGNSTLSQIGATIDAVDTWMLETGSILRHEPLARLGFFLYMTVVHLWCFGLVFFHTVESEHGDLGQLTDHSRMGLLHAHHDIPGGVA